MERSNPNRSFYRAGTAECVHATERIMTRNIGKFFKVTALVAASALAAGLPVLASAQHSGGHGGGGGGGGGHFSGGGHAGGAHFAAPHAVGHVGGAYHYGGAYSAGFHGGYVHGGYAAGHAYVRPAAGYRFYGGHPYWGGGWWHGGYWPRAYYGWGFPWFLPVLPALYATYWWGGVPYYYANDVYYTWSPDYSGYVATDPPPVSDSSSPGSAVSSDAPPPEAASQPLSGAPAQIFMYPKNGQSTEQQAQDRAECQQWA